MGLKKVGLDVGPMDIGSMDGGPQRRQGQTLDAAHVIEVLGKQCPGIVADRGGRHGLWHPRIETRQGLYFYHKHLCAIDRGEIRQWPEWSAEEELVEVPVEYAITHDDFPICMGACDEDSPLPDTAFVFRSKPQRCEHLGWQELFYRLLSHDLPNITRPWIERTFRVDLSPMIELGDSPVAVSFKQLDQSLVGERPVNFQNAQLPNTKRQDSR